MDIVHLLKTFGETAGYLILFAVIFAESGLLIGFFLPGDSVLFTAGFLASQDFFSLPILITTCFVAAVLGDSVGFSFGKKVGRKLFQREDSWLFHRKNIVKAQNFYEKYGAKTIVIARFMPVVRTFAPIVAGIGNMHYRKFVTFNFVGAVLWAIGLNLAGYFLGSLIPDVDKYLLPIVLLIIILSVAPSVYHLLKDRENREQIFKLIQKFLRKIGFKYG